MTGAAPLIVLSAGGTGGHMFPAQALAEALLARGYRVQLSTDARGARYTSGFPDAVEIRQVEAATFARGGVLAKLAAPFRILRGGAAARRDMVRDRPVAVIGFGGYPSVPALIAAVMLRLPRVIHEQNGVLGRVNRLFAGHVDAVACGTWPTDLPKGVSGVHIGNPVRRAVLDKAAARYEGTDSPARILVIGGSQGARILSDVVPAAIASLPGLLGTPPGDLHISHQARAEDMERVRAAYGDAGIAAEVQPFFEDVPERMAAARVVISRAGASSLADLSVIGRPSILIPFAAAAADHQTANARGLVEAGGAMRIDERDLSADSLAQALAGILSDPARAAQMAAAAAAAGRPDATARLVALIESLLSPEASKDTADV